MAAEALDRSLTVGGYGRGGSGLVDAATEERYQRRWAQAEQWCRHHGFTPMPMSSYTLALLVQSLVQDMGYGRAVAEQMCDAVRWKHRMMGGDDAGYPPPDRLRAWFVLRYGEGMPPEVPDRLIRPACREDLAEAGRVCDLGELGDVRDQLVLVLTFVLGLPPAGLAGLRLRRVRKVRGGFEVAAGPGRVVRLECRQWHDDPALAAAPTESVCPVCLLRRWLGALQAAGAAGGQDALLRAVDWLQRPAGAPGYGGKGSAAGPDPRSVVAWIRERVAVAGLDSSVTRRPVTSLRLGGALELHMAGAPLEQVAEHAGFKSTSGMLARYLVWGFTELFRPRMA